MVIGILAVQGAFIEHQAILNRLNVKNFQIRNKVDLNRQMDGIILPGGESTAMGKLLNDLDMMNDLKRLIHDGLPVFGTCAGMILLAETIEHEDKKHIGLMNITVERNGYGRQLSSFLTEAPFNNQKIPMTFIRAPYITKKGENVTILSTVDGRWVAAREKNMLATAFHPELTNDTSVHVYFLEMISSLS
jgi:5'-phosphate synthase pdxT subunit